MTKPNPTPTCKGCGKAFGKQSKRQTHCSLRCALKSRLSLNSETGCLEWSGGLSSTGYGRVGFLGNIYYCHRVSYEMHKGPIPDGLIACHKCDNPKCCNPEHLFLGTQADNMRDMGRKGRQWTVPPLGESHNRAKLSEADVRYIRSCGLSAQRIAELYRMSPRTIYRVLNRETWKSV